MLDSARRKSLDATAKRLAICHVCEKTQPQLHLEDLEAKPKAKGKQLPVAAMQGVPGKARSSTRTYISWRAMLSRCFQPKCHGFNNYGGRGITVCDRWRNSFEAFLADMGERPEGMVLDRKEVNGHYEPGNCRWVTELESQRNKRKIKFPFLANESSRDRHRRVAKDWEIRNKLKRAESKRLSGQLNKAKRREMDRARYAKNPARKLASCRKYYQQHGQSRVAYYQKNRLKMIANATARYWRKKQEAISS